MSKLKQWLNYLPDWFKEEKILEPIEPIEPKHPFEKIAVYSNEKELTDKLNAELKKYNLVDENCDYPVPTFFVYLVDKGMVVSHLYLEMWHPSYTLMYADEFIKEIWKRNGDFKKKN